MKVDFSSFEIASFDLWDTLLHRDVHPDEIKYILSRWIWLNLNPTIKKKYTPSSIYALRKEIEDTICNEDWEYRFAEVATEIIKRLGGDKSFNCCITPEILEDVELHIEDSHTFCRKEGVDLLKSLHEKCSSILIISDFYHSSEWIGKLIKLKGLDEYLTSVISSSDQLLTKRSGKIYDYLLLQMGSQTWIHIGDNEHADVNVPRQKKINAMHLPIGSQANYYKRREIGFRSTLLPRNRESFIHNLRLRKLASNSHFSSKAPVNQCGLNLTGKKAALMLAGFILQIIEDSIGLQTTNIHFFSREGIFFKELYDIACQLDVFHLGQYAKAEILDVSRIATFAASLNEVSIEEFMRIWRLYSHQSPASLLKSLNLSLEIDNLSSCFDGDINEVITYPWENSDFLKFFHSDPFQMVVGSSITMQKERLLNFASTKSLTLSDEIIQIVDIGWRGTIQDNIASIFKDSKVHGNYLGLERFLNPQPSNATKRGFVGDNNSMITADHFDFGDFAVFEFICNVPGGSVTGYSENAEVQRKIVSGEESVILNEGLIIQAGIKEAIVEIFKYLKKGGLTSESLITLARETIIDLKKNPSPELCDSYNKLEHNETFGSGSADQLLEDSNFQELHSKTSAYKYNFFKELWDECRWKQSLTHSSKLKNYIESTDTLSKLSIPSKVYNLVNQSLENVSVCILVPHVINGSGGHRTIFNLAKGLLRAGANVEIQLESFNEALQYVYSEMNGYEFKLTEWWRPGTCCDVAIATVGYSPEFLAKEINAEYKFYFVQDYEASFNPVSDGYVMNQNSYNFGLIPLCVGTWLPHILKTQHNISSFYSGLGSDPDIYKLLNTERCIDVAFLFQPEKHRRLGKSCVDALNSLHKVFPTLKVVSYGSTKEPNLCFDSTHLGLVSDLTQLNKLYNTSKLGLCISLTNPSRIPYEMMRTGCVPIDVFRYNNLFDYAPLSASLAYQDYPSLELAMRQLLNDPKSLQIHSNSAIKFSKPRTLDWEIDILVNAINYVVHGGNEPPIAPKPIYHEMPIISEEGVNVDSVQAFCNWQKQLSLFK